MLRTQGCKTWLLGAAVSSLLWLSACASGISPAPDIQQTPLSTNMPKDKATESGASAEAGGTSADKDKLTRAAGKETSKPASGAEPVKASDPGKPSEPREAAPTSQREAPKTQTGASPSKALPADNGSAAPASSPSSAPAAPGPASIALPTAPAAASAPNASAAAPESEPSAVSPAEAAQPQQSANAASSGPEAKTAAVSVRIVGDKQKGTIMDTTQVELQQGDTVIDVLKRITKDKKIQMETRGTGKSSYVEGIANLYEFDKGAKSGWLYQVNGKFPNVSAGAYTLNKGDRIEWLYTLNLGKDVGKDPDK